MVKIKELRKKAKISQSKLADQLNIRQSTVAMWESGTNRPRTEMLPALARIFECSIDELF